MGAVPARPIHERNSDQKSLRVRNTCSCKRSETLEPRLERIVRGQRSWRAACLINWRELGSCALGGLDGSCATIRIEELSHRNPRRVMHSRHSNQASKSCLSPHATLQLLRKRSFATGPCGPQRKRDVSNSRDDTPLFFTVSGSLRVHYPGQGPGRASLQVSGFIQPVPGFNVLDTLSLAPGSCVTCGAAVIECVTHVDSPPMPFLSSVPSPPTFFSFPCLSLPLPSYWTSSVLLSSHPRTFLPTAWTKMRLSTLPFLRLTFSTQ